MNAKLLFIQALSPLHAGTGQGVGVIDLPIAREKATNLPYLPGSSLKGVLRAACEESQSNQCEDIFGPKIENASDHASSVHFTDQRLLLMPIRSLAGTFAWVTSPFVLRRFVRDSQMAGQTGFPPVPDVSEQDACLVANNTALKGFGGKVVLEDIDLAVGDSADAWAQALAFSLFPGDKEWQKVFQERFCIVHGEIFGFLVETATEVVARIALEDNKKTVKQGALWYEESLPAETVLSGLVVASQVKANPQTVFGTVANLTKKPLQLGGNATVGRGLCQLRMV